MLCWERLLLSSIPDTILWPPRSEQKGTATPLVSLAGRVSKQSRALAPVAQSTLASPARATKRRPSVLGGGFSTAGPPSASSLASNSCLWGEHNPDHGARDRSPPRPGRPGRRGSRSESRGSDDYDDDDRDDDGAGAGGSDDDHWMSTTEMSVIGWGDRCRRRSSLRESREGASEGNDCGLTGSSASADNPHQKQERDPRKRRNSTVSEACRTTRKTEEDNHKSWGDQQAGSCLSAEGRRGQYARRLPAAYVDIVSRETTGSDNGDSASVSISVGYTAAELKAACPVIAPISPQSEAPQRDPPSAITSPDNSDLENAGSAVPTLGPGCLTTASSTSSNSQASQLPLQIPGDGGGDGDNDLLASSTATYTTRCMNGAASAPSLSTLGSLSHNPRGVSVPNSPKVFHNFVFRRSNRRTGRTPASSLGRKPGSSSSGNSTMGAGLADGSSISTSRDTVNNRSMNKNNVACNLLSGAPSAGVGANSGAGRSAMGRCGSIGGGAETMTSPWRRRNTESPQPMYWDSTRPERPGRAKRTSPPPRTANDAFSVRSFSSSSSSAAPSLNLHPAEAGSAGVSRGGCRSGGTGRPLKCQRCGSGRVRLFASPTEATRCPSLDHPLRKHAHEDKRNPRGNRTTRLDFVGGSGHGGECGRGVGGGAGPLSAGPMRDNPNNLATTPQTTSLSDNNRLSGWSDTSRPLSTAPTARSTTTPSFGRRGGPDAANRAGGVGGGTPAVRSGRRPSVKPPMGGGALAPARPPLQLPSVSSLR